MISLFLHALLSVAGPADHQKQPLSLEMRNRGFAAPGTGPTQSGIGSAYGADAAMPTENYRLSGEKSLRPSRISDDGVHMYLEWTEDQALPAVFALNAISEEEMVDGYMRQGIFTIDRIYPKLVFRIGKKRAIAERVRK